MKNKIMRKVFLILVIFITLFPIITYSNNTGGAFFTVSKTEISPGKTVIMTVNLDKIDYEEWKFTLSSNVSLSDVTSDSPVDTSLNGNSLQISATKSEISMQQIELYYNVPETVSVGSTITLTAKIEPVVSTTEITPVSEEVTETVEEENQGEVDDIESELTEENTIEQMPQENQSSKQESVVAEAQEVTVTIKVVETSDEEDDENQKDEKKISEKEDMNKEMEMDKEKNSKDKNDMEKDEMDEKSSTKKVSSNVSTTTTSETVVYNGESNNYLSSLNVEGYDFTQIFSKTNNTYFLTVASDVTNVTVNAMAEDSNATVNIYGNTNLVTGKNKILISVTAENGEVKIYRIYVTK